MVNICIGIDGIQWQDGPELVKGKEVDATAVEVDDEDIGGSVLDDMESDVGDVLGV